jgi:hypothetical protein
MVRLYVAVVPHLATLCAVIDGVLRNVDPETVNYALTTLMSSEDCSTRARRLHELVR